MTSHRNGSGGTDGAWRPSIIHVKFLLKTYLPLSPFPLNISVDAQGLAQKGIRVSIVAVK